MSCRNQNRRSFHLRDPLNHSMHQHPKNKFGPAKATRNLFFLVHLCPKTGPQSDTPSHSWHSMSGKVLLGTPLPSKGHGSVQGSLLQFANQTFWDLFFCFPRLFFHFFGGKPNKIIRSSLSRCGPTSSGQSSTSSMSLFSSSASKFSRNKKGWTVFTLKPFFFDTYSQYQSISS